MRFRQLRLIHVLLCEDGDYAGAWFPQRLFSHSVCQSKASRTPAATAEPMTPETLGPMACMIR